jgi:hypothetical protein
VDGPALASSFRPLLLTEKLTPAFIYQMIRHMPGTADDSNPEDSSTENMVEALLLSLQLNEPQVVQVDLF